jgi:hypothetical protein
VNATAHPLVEGYLRSLDGAAKVLPRRERDELVTEIRAHLDEAVPPGASEADVRNALDALGAPWDIVAAAGGEAKGVRRGPREVFALLLLVTGLPPFIGWFVGLGLLIWSPLWTTRQKWLGALVWPGGLLGLVFTFALPASSSSVTLCSGSTAHAVTTCTTSGGGMNPLWWIVITLAAAAPICVAAYLWRAAGRRAAA